VVVVMALKFADRRMDLATHGWIGLVMESMN
jgi:hypothetical protein